ncbi:hypothetical protein ACFL2E_09510 [Thermodesulfobacteriota bacterium]
MKRFRIFTLPLSFLLLILLFGCPPSGGGGDDGGGSGGDCAPSYDASGTWSTEDTKIYDSDGEPLEDKQGTLAITQTGDSFSMETDEGDTLDGTVCGAIYTFTGDFGQVQAPTGEWGTATVEGTLELTSEITFEGGYTFTWTDGSHTHTEDWEVIGAKQISPQPSGCGDGLPLTLSNLSFPGTGTGGQSYDGSVDYQGSFEDITNPRILLKFPFTGGYTITYSFPDPTASNCTIFFKGTLPDSISGNVIAFFKLVDYSGDDDGFVFNWDNNGVANVLSQAVTIN